MVGCAAGGATGGAMGAMGDCAQPPSSKMVASVANDVVRRVVDFMVVSELSEQRFQAVPTTVDNSQSVGPRRGWLH